MNKPLAWAATSLSLGGNQPFLGRQPAFPWVATSLSLGGNQPFLGSSNGAFLVFVYHVTLNVFDN
jgi:hypothetical protein